MKHDARDFERLSGDIKRLLEDLSPATRHAAEHIINNPTDTAVYSMRELSKKADVAPATLLRLARRLGYVGYDDFRSVFTRSLLADEGRNVSQAHKVQQTKVEKGINRLAGEIIRGETVALENTIRSVDDHSILAAAQILCKARNVYVAGRRMSFPPAYNLAYCLRKTRPSIFLVEEIVGGFKQRIRDMADRLDCAIVVTLHPYSHYTHELCEDVRDAGGSVIVITDSMIAPACGFADHVFIADTDGSSFPKTTIGVMAIINILVSMVVAELGEDAFHRIHEDELSAEASGEYIFNGSSKRKQS